MTDVFAPDLGHAAHQQFLLESMRRNRLPHALLFHGPEGSGKEAFALALARLLNSSSGKLDAADPQQKKIARLQHPDVKLIFPLPAKSNLKEDEHLEVLKVKTQNPFRRAGFKGKKTSISIEMIRDLKRESRFRLYEGIRKVFIFSEADQMRQEAANALLKLLEEPPDNLVLILVTSQFHRILPTIKSRCQMMHFNRLGEAELTHLLRSYLPDLPPEKLQLHIRLSGYNIKRIFDFQDRDVLAIREQGIDLLRKAVLIHRGQELFGIIEPLVARKDPEEIRLLLWFLLLWFQDILHLNYGDRGSWKLFNADKFDTLEKFRTYIPNADLHRVVWDIEQTLQDLADVRNFNPLLLLTNLAVNIKSGLKK